MSGNGPVLLSSISFEHRFALRNGPYSLIAVIDHLSQFFELLREIDNAEGGFPAAVNVIAVHGPMIVEELQVFLVDLSPKFPLIDAAGGRGSRAEQTFVQDFGHDFIAMFVQVDAVDG